MSKVSYHIISYRIIDMMPYSKVRICVCQRKVGLLDTFTKKLCSRDKKL